MGANAEIILFDHHRYLSEVVPAFRELLLTGPREPGLDQLLSSARARAVAAADRHDHPTNHRVVDFHRRLAGGLGIDLERHCRLLDRDLSPTRPLTKITRFLGGWSDRRCRHAPCPEVGRCPLFQADGIEAEALFVAVLHPTVGRCLGQRAFIGRSINLSTWLLWLEELEVPAGAPVVGLLRRLGVRGFHIGYQWANSDGIHGWLSPEETAELAELMADLPLPPLPPTLEAIPSTLTAFPDGSRRYHIEGWERSSLLLAFVRSIAGLARQRGMGVLLGLDLSTG